MNDPEDNKQKALYCFYCINNTVLVKFFGWFSVVVPAPERGRCFNELQLGRGSIKHNADTQVLYSPEDTADTNTFLKVHIPNRVLCREGSSVPHGPCAHSVYCS